MRYSARMLLKRPGLTLIIVLTLALGIGANTTVFSVISAVLLRALPFPFSAELVDVGSTKTINPSASGLLSYPDFVDLRSRNRSFEHFAVYRTRGFTIVGAGGAVRLRGTVARADLFPLLGVTTLYGRTFTPAEDTAGGGRALILSHGLWQQRFDADPKVIGRTVAVNGETYTIVGVMPPHFRFPIEVEPVEMWTNFARDTENFGIGAISSERGNRYLNAIGRLRPGVTPAQAARDLAGIAVQLEQQYPRDNQGFSVIVTPLLERLTGKVRRSLWVIFTAVGFVLMIACANVASLLLSRGLNRRQEITVRYALGANRRRVIQLLLTDSILLAVLGAAAGLLLASFGTDVLIAIAPEDIPRMSEARVDGRVLVFTAAIATLTGIAMGLMPAWQTSQSDLQSVLGKGARNLADSRATLRSALVVAQVALAVVLLVGAGLLIQSFARLVRVDPGFDAGNLLTMAIGLSDGPYSTPDQIAGFHERLMAGLEGVAGVSAYSTVNPLPLMGRIKVGFNIEGRAKEPGHAYPFETHLFLVGADYFRTLGIALQQGREYDPRDNLHSKPVVIINESFARRFFYNQNPLGQRIDPAMSADDRPLPMREIVGVVADSRTMNLSESAEPEVYLHIPQCPATSVFTLLLRTRSDAVSIIPYVREAVAKLDPNVPVYRIRTFESYVASSLTRPRYNTILLSVFAGLALLLTAIGLYGVISFSMSLRTQEIGIRLALGAKPRDIVRLILRQGLKLVLLGVILGLGGAFALSRVIEQMLFGVRPADPLTMIVISLLMISVTLLACWIPARRATRLDPMIALRYE